MMNDVGGLCVNVCLIGGSVFNMNGIKFGEFDMVIVQNDVVYYVYKGIGIDVFKGKVNFNVCLFVVFYFEVLYVIVCKDVGINIIVDFKGKCVVMGDFGLGSEQIVVQVFEVYGLSFSDFGQ